QVLAGLSTGSASQIAVAVLVSLSWACSSTCPARILIGLDILPPIDSGPRAGRSEAPTDRLLLLVGSCRMHPSYYWSLHGSLNRSPSRTVIPSAELSSRALGRPGRRKSTRPSACWYDCGCRPEDRYLSGSRTRPA